MSNTGVQETPEATRRHLSERQVRTVDGLLEAAMDELHATGYPDLSIRSVARRAGVAPATAYTYFASKEHLVAELYWRRFMAQPTPATSDATTVRERVVGVLSTFALVVAHEAELSAACTVAVLAEDPDVKVLRERIGAELHRRLRAALGPDADPAVLRTLHFAVAGLLLQVGTGHVDHSSLPHLLDEVARTVIGGTDK